MTFEGYPDMNKILISGFSLSKILDSSFPFISGMMISVIINSIRSGLSFAS